MFGGHPSAKRPPAVSGFHIITIDRHLLPSVPTEIYPRDSSIYDI